MQGWAPLSGPWLSINAIGQIVLVLCLWVRGGIALSLCWWVGVASSASVLPVAEMQPFWARAVSCWCEAFWLLPFALCLLSMKAAPSASLPKEGDLVQSSAGIVGHGGK